MPPRAFSPDRIARLSTVLNDHVDFGSVAGVAGLVERYGETHVVVAGVQDLESRTPVQRDSIFRLSSMTKPVTAAATMILIEQCQIRLDDPVDPLLPELADRQVLRTIGASLDDTVPATRSITVRDLLAFTMGFGIVMALPGTWPIQTATEDLDLGQGPPSPSGVPEPDEWMRRLGTLPLMHQPGERWMYNTGADVLGVLIARASGQSFESFLADRLFGPLGMTDTGFSVPPEKLDRLVTSYALDPAAGAPVVYDPAAGGQWAQAPAFPAGGAGLVSTLDDYLAFARMLHNKGMYRDSRVLSRASVEVMTSNQLTPAQVAKSDLPGGFFDNNGWGFGMSVTTRRTDLAAVPGNYGWNGGMGTTWRNDPTNGVIGILLTQTMFTSPEPPGVVRDFWTTAYQAIVD